MNASEQKGFGADAARVLSSYIASFEGRAERTLRLYRSTIQSFLAFVGGRAIDEDRVLEWMTREAGRCAANTAAAEYRIVGPFLRAATRDGFFARDPMEAIRARFDRRGSREIALALKTPEGRAPLETTRARPPFTGPLGAEMRAYVDLKRSLGAQYRTEAQTLAGFDRFVASEAIASPEAITPEPVQGWIAAMTCAPITRSAKVHLLARFFDHLVGRGVIAQNPVRVARRCRWRTPSFQPYIFRKEEVAALLATATTLAAHRRFPLRPETVHMVLALLYGLGLRLGEALALKADDVDFERGTLLIRKTKFYKARLVPFGPRLGACFARYIDRRRTIFPPFGIDDPLFVALYRRPISPQAVRRAFRALVGALGIGRSQGRPRLHDLRHSFAVHRLLRWYREGVDVQTRLPRLSTFMGHTEVTSTQVYLTATTDLLDAANARFHERFGSFVEEARR